MRVEKTNTGIIIREPNYNIKQKCLEYFSLSDPLREYFIYSGNDPNNKPKFGNEHDVIYITSGFGKIDDPIIKKVMNTAHRVQPKKPSPIELSMSREPRSDLQRDCIKLLVSSDTPKITVQLKPGVGKTFIAMYSASQLGLKPLIVTPSTLLKNQWIEEIEDCGIDKSEIATDIYEVDKKCCVVTITSIENAIRDDWEGCLNAINNGQYGIKIIDEAHLHLKGMLKFDALCNIQHNWYLSATLGRSDGDEDKILNRSLLDSTRFIGSKKYLEYQKEYIRVYQQDIYYQPSQQLCNECFKYGKKGLIKSSYYDMLMEYKNGVPFITNMIDMVKKVRALTKSSKKVLLLIPMLDIIHRVMNVMKGDPYFKSLNVVMVDGSMPLRQKRENLDNGNIILATTQSMGVGVDVQDLIAVVNFDQLASPISLEQIVGRLRDRGYETVYIDVCDKVKYAKAISNWGARRREMFPYFPGVHKEMYKFPNIYS